MLECISIICYATLMLTALNTNNFVMKALETKLTI